MKTTFYLIGVVAGILAVGSPVWAGEYAVLTNGFRLHADRHEVAGDKVLLLEEGGVTELPASAISEFEVEESVPASPLPVALPVQTTHTSVPAKNIVDGNASPRDLAADAAKKYYLPPGFVASVMKAESNFHPGALSPKGAIGLMQLMPSTARTLGVNPANSRENAHGGAQYLRELLTKYESRPDQVLLALAAYNAGPGAVEKFHGVPPYRETREYILRVLKNWQRLDAEENGAQAAR